jgi:hypothetical protein
MGAEAVDDVLGASHCRGLPARGLDQLVHHDVWPPIRQQRNEIARSGNPWTAEQSRASFYHLLKRIRRPILIGSARLRTHSRRWRPDRPDLEAMALHLSSEVGPVATMTS